MIAIATFLRRTAAALGAIAALTATGVATAQQTVTLSGASSNTCSFSGQMTVRPDGSIEIPCSGTTTAKFALTAPTSLTTNTANSGTQVKVTRSGATAGAADVAFTATGACSAVTTSPLQFADAGSLVESIELSTNTTVGNCIVTLTSTTLGSITSPVSRTIKVSDPDSDVVFAFSAPSSTGNVGGGAVTITVTRTGGINGTWSVPFTLSGTLASTADDGQAANGELSGILTFTGSTNGITPGNQTDTLTYAPPTTAVGTPANLIISLGTPTGGTPPQAATVGTPHEVTVNSAPVGCPVPETIANSMLAAYANGTTLRMPSGTIATFVLPAPTLNKSTGQFYIAAGTSTYPVAPYYFEIHINKCKGLVQATTGDTCYAKFATKTGYYGKVWFTKTLSGNASYDTVAEIKGRGYCYAPATEGPWYVNIRYTYAGCDISGNCGWNYQWQNWTY